MAVYGNGTGAANGADEKRDAFVGGLSPDTTESDLNTYFSQFGPVLHSVVKRDLNTGLSRGFGFVTFADSTGLSKINTVATHILKGKKIDAKAAVRKSKDAVTKIFVGGIDTNMSEDDVKAYFEAFGKVSAIQWPKDRLRDNAKKNFVFVEFDDANVVETLVKTPKHSIGSRLCDVRKAVPAAAKPPGAYDPYTGGAAYGGAAYGAGAYGGYPAYGAPPAYDPAAYGGYYGYDPNAAAYDQSAYAGYGDPAAAAYAGYGAADQSAAAAATAAHDPYATPAAAPATGYEHATSAGSYGTVGYPGAEASAYPPPARPAYRPRAMPPMAARPPVMRPPAYGAPPGVRAPIRGFHPYRRV